MLFLHYISICNTLATEGPYSEVPAESHRSKWEFSLKKKVKSAKLTVNFLSGLGGFFCCLFVLRHLNLVPCVPS